MLGVVVSSLRVGGDLRAAAAVRRALRTWFARAVLRRGVPCGLCWFARLGLLPAPPWRPPGVPPVALPAPLLGPSPRPPRARPGDLRVPLGAHLCLYLRIFRNCVVVSFFGYISAKCYLNQKW